MVLEGRDSVQVQLNTRVSVETMTSLRQYAEQAGRSMASIVEAALKEYLERESEKV